MYLKKFRIVYAIIFIVQLGAINLAYKPLILFTKPLICLALMLFLYLETKLTGKFKKRIFIGLGFALIGDVFLMFNKMNPNYFIYGLISFLLCHLLYISAFDLDIKSNKQVKNPYFGIAGIVLTIFIGAFYVSLKAHLGSLKIPVLIYSFVISFMMALAIGRWGRVNSYSFKLIATGAFLFLISDSILAYNQFVSSNPNSGIGIMGTYMLAQFLITYGTIERQLLTKQTEIN